jgi:hypothetical protein
MEMGGLTAPDGSPHHLTHNSCIDRPPPFAFPTPWSPGRGRPSLPLVHNLCRFNLLGILAGSWQRTLRDHMRLPLCAL